VIFRINDNVAGMRADKAAAAGSQTTTGAAYNES
jgi:hypothetical protein